MFTYWLEFVWCLDRHHILRPKQIHSTKPSCQMFVKISHSLTGSLIIFDCTLFSSSLSIHFSVSYLANEAHCWFTFSPCHQSSGQHCWHWEWLEEKKKTKSSDRLEQTISAWSKLLSGREHCVQWLERGEEEGTVVKQITSTQSFSDTAVHGMEWKRSHNPLIITTILMSSLYTYLYNFTASRDSCNCILIQLQPLSLELSYYYLWCDNKQQQ